MALKTISLEESFKNGPMVKRANLSRRKRASSILEQISEKESPLKSPSPSQTPPPHVDDEPPLYVSLMVAFGFGLLIVVGYFRDFFIYLASSRQVKEPHREDYKSLFYRFEEFYLRNMFCRSRDVFETPICSVPGATTKVMERITQDNYATLQFSGRRLDTINIGSYNYLGFAQAQGPCRDSTRAAILKYGVAIPSSRTEMGSIRIHRELERLTAEYLGVEDALSFGMGFATNALNLPSLVGPNCLVLSDQFNHSSLIVGLKISGATIKVFKHNDLKDLEKRLKKAIIEGHPRTHRPWRKILIVVEGIYSMEGNILHLPTVIAIKKKYKAYLYIDEAHSIGALGTHGRGVCEYFGCDPRDVDILMGTYTKGFAAAGGYIAGSKELISYLKLNSDAQHYATSMGPCVAQQIITSMGIIMGRDGTSDGKHRIAQLRRNATYLRQSLIAMGFVVLGHDDSPVIPVMVYSILKGVALVRAMRERGISIVTVGFPATAKLTGSRVRFCVSAGHTQAMLDKVLVYMDDLGEQYGVKYGKISKKEITW